MINLDFPTITFILLDNGEAGKGFVCSEKKYTASVKDVMEMYPGVFTTAAALGMLEAVNKILKWGDAVNQNQPVNAERIKKALNRVEYYLEYDLLDLDDADEKEKNIINRNIAVDEMLITEYKNLLARIG